jgi:hypothetical protein
MVLNRSDSPPDVWQRRSAGIDEFEQCARCLPLNSTSSMNMTFRSRSSFQLH